MNHFTPPNSGFILITDNQGDIVDHYPENCVIDDIFRRIQVLDSENPDDSPHSSWRWHSDSPWRWHSETKSYWGRFIQVYEVVGKDPK